MIAYAIEFNDIFLIESLERYRSQAVRRNWRVTIKLLCFLGLAFLFGICVWAKIYSIAVLFIFFILLLLIGSRIDYWLIKRRFRKSPFYQHRFRIELQAEGFKETSELSKIDLKWGALTRVVRLDDGFLIFTDPRQFRWWPDSALVDGNVAEVNKLLEQQVRGLD